MRGSFVLARHLGCGVLATILIAAGRARRARRQLSRTPAITAVYFHNPAGRLFERCIEWMIREGYTFISAQALIEILSGEATIPPRAAWISLDDGYTEWLTSVIPVARKYKVPLTLFISPGLVEGDGLLPWRHDASYPTYEPGHSGTSNPGQREVISVKQLREVAGLEEITIGGHTVNHVIMTLCSDDKLRVEIEECRRKLEEITGEPIRSFAYPAGQCDARGPEYLREIGYLLAATTEARFVAPATNPFLVPRFCVPDEVTFPEAICNMLGIWHPFLNRVKKLLRLAPPQPYAAPVDNRKNTAGGKYASQ